MKKFTIFFCSAIIGLALASCTKQEPTAVNMETLQIKSSVKGFITYVDGTDIEEATSAKVVVVVKQNGVDEKGNSILINAGTFTTTSDSKNGSYTVKLPLAAGESYEIEVSASFEEDVKLKDDKGVDGSVTASFFGSTIKSGVIAGEEVVATVLCDVIGVVSDSNYSKQEK